MKSFLTAEWRKLLVINYEVNDALLLPYLPVGTELDLFEEKCYVSLIGFMFLNTKVKGIKFPGLNNFEEVNLRFYVKRKVNGEWRRGVVFIKELVPNKILASIANLFYKEHYEAVKMQHEILHNGDSISLNYQWKYCKNANSITAKASITYRDLRDGEEAHFILEHYFGYTKVNENKSFEYEVQHPIWKVYDVIEFAVNVDFKNVYGKDFAFLIDRQPVSVFLAEGSEVEVCSKLIIQN